MSEQMVGIETLFAHMDMAVKTLNRAMAIAVYERMEPEIVERLYREVLTAGERSWLETLVKKWKHYKERLP